MLLEFLVYVRLGNLAIWVRNVSDAGSFDSDSQLQNISCFDITSSERYHRHS
jgi:hypothetical protein